LWTVELSPLTELADNGLLQLHSANDNAVAWLADVTMKALAKSTVIAVQITQ